MQQVQAGLLLVEVKTMLEKFAENYLPREGSHGTAEETLFLKHTEERFLRSEILTKTPVLFPCAVGGKRERRGKKGVLKVCFGCHYPFYF